MTTLLYVPGLLSDARVWREVAEGVGGGFVIADVTTQNSITAMAQSVLALAEGPVIPVGHSMGGRVSMEMARLAPERMAGLVLADTGHNALAEGERAKREAKVAEGNADMGAMVTAWLPPMVGASRHSDAALMGDLTEMSVACGPEVHARQIGALINRPDAGASLGGVTCPVLLLVGDEDVWSPEPQHREIAGMVSGPSDVVVVEGAGHFLPYEKPEAVIEAMTDWLAAQDLR
ncbi:alpha/beta fold hydrolase [Psychromarinibacter sp. S121]|uniref:alpha/beta fold hydrolase n=1 Tax=Psychromarinibacter sp. S121 TaxID=3415127 RepID=UPI003C79B18D